MLWLFINTKADKGETTYGQILVRCTSKGENTMNGLTHFKMTILMFVMKREVADHLFSLKTLNMKDVYV